MIYFLKNHHPAEFQNFLLMWHEAPQALSPGRGRHLFAAILTVASIAGILILS